MWGHFQLLASVDNFEWAFACVYGPNDDNDKEMLWDELGGLISWWELLWCIWGDFNIIRYQSKRSRNTCHSPAMLEFLNSSLNKTHGYPFVRGNFTWSINCDLPSWPRIVRFLLSPDCETQFPNVSQRRSL